MQAEEIKEKSKQTCRENYGADYYLQTSECIENTKNICLEKYGVTNISKIPEVRQKIKETCLEKYGVTSYLGTKDAITKNKQYFKNKYGVEHPILQKYVYQNQFFDSFPELCFYMYHFENNISIIREPIKLSYVYENKTYNYFPDFSVDDQLIEIKGDQFLSEDLKWCNPFDHTLDEQMEAKHQCALENGVKILYKSDYQKYIDWFYEQDYKKEEYKFNKSN